MTARKGAKLEQPPTPKLPALTADGLPERNGENCRSEALQAAARLAKHTKRRANTLCRLTLELSGGEAVRLERNVRRLRRSLLGRQRLPRRAQRLNNRPPQNYQL